MLKRTLACALFAITGHVYSADIQVTTLVDEDKDDTVCSLREAVTFLNNRTQKEYENGYHGCGDKDASSIIILQRDKEYTLNNAIQIKAEMTINTAVSTDFNDSKKGLNNATIKMLGSESLFIVDDNNVEKDTLLVNFNELNLKGSAQKVVEGGLILNRETLTIKYSRLTNGNATLGGAIYNKGLLSDKNTVGMVSINNSILEGNKADQGAVIYSEIPRYYITQSVIHNNEVKTNGSILYVQNAYNDNAISNALTTGVFGIRNATIFNNKGGYVANIRGGMMLNNITMIYNDAGLYLQAPQWTSTTTSNNTTTTKLEDGAYISNSIIAKNNKNCVVDSGDSTVIQSNLTELECDRNAPAGRPNFLLNTDLLAGSQLEGDCDLPQDKGLLCPYATPKDQMLGFFQPRLLASYNSLSESLIINKGRIFSDGTTIGRMSCESSDQRGKSRSVYGELCDLGAIELVVNRSDVQIAGQDILYGQTAKFSIANSLLDGELVTPEACKAIFKRDTDAKGLPWQPGCLEVEQTETISKGRLTLDSKGNVIYVPNANWHGADKFNIRIITTITRLNDSSNYYIDIPTTIVQDPPNNFQSRTVNVGSMDFGWILMIFGLIGFRRFKS
jgi:rhombotarget A family protien